MTEWLVMAECGCQVNLSDLNGFPVGEVILGSCGFHVPGYKYTYSPVLDPRPVDEEGQQAGPVSFYSVPCPHCGAGIGKPCTQPSGRVGAPHATRRARARLRQGGPK